jgi:hypothetical protein
MDVDADLGTVAIYPSYIPNRAVLRTCLNRFLADVERKAPFKEKITREVEGYRWMCSLEVSTKATW